MIMEATIPPSGIYRSKESIFSIDGILLAVLTTTAAVLNMLLLRVLQFSWHTFQKTYFYLLVSSFSFASTIYLMCNFLVMIPYMFAGYHLYQHKVMILICAMNSIGYYTMLFTNVAIALERLAIFFLKKSGHPSRKIFISIPWLLSAIVLLTAQSIGCHKSFDLRISQYIFECSTGSASAHMIFQKFLFCLGQVLSVAILACYAAIIIKVTKMRKYGGDNGTLPNRQQYRLVVQFAFICLFQWLSSLLFFVIPNLHINILHRSLLINTISIGNTMYMPIVLFLTNALIRETFCRFIKSPFKLSSPHIISIEAVPISQKMKIRSVAIESSIQAGHLFIQGRN